MPDGPMTRHGNALSKRPIRSRNGCLTCRRRKKKCDENRPFCTGCYRNNLECEWESNESISTPRRRNRRSRGHDHSLPVEVQRMMKVFFVLTPDLVTRLLGHFFDDSPKWLSTRTGSRRTEYMKWLSPAISESRLVLNCILTIASADLLKYHRGNREMRCAVAEYYGIAISGLRKAIVDEMNVATPSDTSLPDYTPLAVLLLCVHETQNFTQSERILPHVNAAVFLLQNRTFRKGPDTGLRSFLFESFCYFFALASFSLGSKMPLRGAYHIFNAPSVIEYLREGHIMGTSQHIFTAIYEISSLTPQITSRNPAEVSIARTQLMSLDEDLSGSYTKPDLVEDMNSGDLNDAITSELYRLACRIHIKTLLTPSAPDEDPTMLKLVETFADQLHMLPSDSPSNSILSWPLVVAGLSAKINAHQRIIVAKLTQIYDEWQSDIFSKGAAFLKAKWKRDRYPKKRVQLVEIEDSSGPGFRQVPVESVGEADPIWNKCPVILA